MNVEGETRPGVRLLKSWINKSIFLCTDRSGNVIIGSCNEYTSDPDQDGAEEEGRILGLAMVPGHHVTRMWVDQESPGTAQRSSSPAESNTCNTTESNTR